MRWRSLAPVLLLGLLLQTTGCAALLAGAAAAGAVAGTAASAKEGREQQHHTPVSYVGAVLVDVVYVPAKAVFAGAGALTSGVTYVVTLGRSEPATTIWNKSTKGNYVVTPSMVEGRAPVRFVG